MNRNIVIVNEKKFREVKNNFKINGPENVCVFSDFDRTLTYGTFNGKKVPSMIAVLREDDNYLDKDYVEKASFLAKKYRPIEFNLLMDEKEKMREMENWWQEHIDLLIKKRINKKHFGKIVSERVVGFREKTKDVFEILKKNGAPMVIISASGLGEDPIQMMIEKELGDFPNVHIVSNSFFYDADGYVVDHKKPIVHTMNKNNVSIKTRSFYKDIENRRNIILLGDSFDDVKMAENIDYNNLLKICFLDEHTEEMIDEYRKIYDVLILKDSSMIFIKDLLEDIFNKK